MALNLGVEFPIGTEMQEDEEEEDQEGEEEELHEFSPYYYEAAEVGRQEADNGEEESSSYTPIRPTGIVELDSWLNSQGNNWCEYPPLVRWIPEPFTLPGVEKSSWWQYRLEESADVCHAASMLDSRSAYLLVDVVFGLGLPNLPKPMAARVRFGAFAILHVWLKAPSWGVSSDIQARNEEQLQARLVNELVPIEARGKQRFRRVITALKTTLMNPELCRQIDVRVEHVGGLLKAVEERLCRRRRHDEAPQHYRSNVPSLQNLCAVKIAEGIYPSAVQTASRFPSRRVGDSALQEVVASVVPHVVTAAVLDVLYIMLLVNDIMPIFMQANEDEDPHLCKLPVAHLFEVSSDDCWIPNFLLGSCFPVPCCGIPSLAITRVLSECILSGKGLNAEFDLPFVLDRLCGSLHGHPAAYRIACPAVEKALLHLLGSFPFDRSGHYALTDLGGESRNPLMVAQQLLETVLPELLRAIHEFRLSVNYAAMYLLRFLADASKRRKGNGNFRATDIEEIKRKCESLGLRVLAPSAYALEESRTLEDKEVAEKRAREDHKVRTRRRLEDQVRRNRRRTEDERLQQTLNSSGGQDRHHAAGS